MVAMNRKHSGCTDRTMNVCFAVVIPQSDCTILLAQGDNKCRKTSRIVSTNPRNKPYETCYKFMVRALSEPTVDAFHYSKPTILIHESSQCSWYRLKKMRPMLMILEL